MDKQEETVTSKIRQVLNKEVKIKSVKKLRIGYPIRIFQIEEGEEE